MMVGMIDDVEALAGNSLCTLPHAAVPESQIHPIPLSAKAARSGSSFSRYRSKRERPPLAERSLSGGRLTGDAGIVADE